MIVAVLIIDIVILKNQNNAADTTTTSNATATFSTITTAYNETITSTTTTATTATTTTTKTTITTTTTTTIMTDCYDWLHINNATSNGIYRIDPGYGLQPFNVYCDMTTDDGGWTVIQRLIQVVSLYSFYLFRRVDDSLEFWNNTWQQYKNGFNNGIESGNLWLGNHRIHMMSQSNVTLRVEINGDRTPNNTNPNIYLYGTYNFSVIKISTLSEFHFTKYIQGVSQVFSH